MTVTLEVHGIEKVERALGKLAAGRWMRGLLTAAVGHMKSAVAGYPHATAANTPRPFAPGADNRWYERGYGQRWARKDGSVGGKRTSEVLGRSWTTQVANDGSWGKVGTKASYSPYVQDADRQAGFHKARGWTTIQEVADKEGDKIVKAMEREIDKIWGG